MNSKNSESDFELINLLYGSALYVVLGVVAIGIIVFTGAEFSLTYVLTGALGGGLLLLVRHVLRARPLLQRVYDIVVFVSLFALATQEITGKLAMVVGICLSTVVISHFLHRY